jgi:hypothetical protein
MTIFKFRLEKQATAKATKKQIPFGDDNKKGNSRSSAYAKDHNQKNGIPKQR